MSARLLLRHPRRLGFVGFNLVVMLLLAWWLRAGNASSEAGLMGVPNFTLASVGVVFLLLAWSTGWIAWTIMILRRHRQTAIAEEMVPPPRLERGTPRSTI